MTRLLVVLAAAVGLPLAAPSGGYAQHAPDLVRFILREHLRAPRADVVCVGVRPAGSEGSRDVTRAELPDTREDFGFAGLSECTRHTLGARHEASGRDALIIEIGIGGVPATGQAWYTWGWFRDGSDAGALRCDVARTGGRWRKGACRPLWSAEAAGVGGNAGPPHREDGRR